VTGASSREDQRPLAIAVVPVRSGLLPVGADETVAEAGGCCWLVGSGCDDAVANLSGPVVHATLVESDPATTLTSSFRVGLAAALLDRMPVGANLILPGSPDGRDLAPHIAAALGRPLVGGATEVTADRAVVARHGGLTMETLALDRPVVATLQPGARSAPIGRDDTVAAGVVERVELPIVSPARDEDDGGDGRDPVELIEELPADPATMDLADATRIIAGGAGLGTADQFDRLHAVAAALGASAGATRVVTDQGWISTDRQIGTTGVTVDPDLYIAIGISGAVQHTAGLGNPEHVVVVNTDPSCPMMALADLGIVCDGPAFVEALESVLDGFSRTPASPAARHERDRDA